MAAAIVSLGEFGILFALPLWFQNVVGYTAFQTGVVLVALAGGSFFASGLGAVIGRRRSPVFIVRVGIVLEIAGVAGLGLLLRPDSTWVIAVPLLFVYGIGVGFATAQLTGVVLADVPVERSGQGSGTQSTARQIGSAFGIAILGTVLFATLESGLTAGLQDLPCRISNARFGHVSRTAQGPRSLLGRRSAHSPGGGSCPCGAHRRNPGGGTHGGGVLGCGPDRKPVPRPPKLRHRPGAVDRASSRRTARLTEGLGASAGLSGKDSADLALA